MEVYLNNVGIIKDSTIKIDGLTVLTGKNNAGKTSVGKVVYSLVRACSNAEKAYDAYRSEYIKKQLDILSGILLEKEVLVSYYLRNFAPKEEIDESDYFLDVLNNHNYINFSPQELITFFLKIGEELPNLTLKEYQSTKNKFYSPSNFGRKKRIKKEKFAEKKEKALEFYKSVVSIITDDKTYNDFEKERIKAFLNHIFRDQVNPVREPEAVANIQFRGKEQELLKLNIKNKNDYNIITETSYELPYNQAILMDDAFVLDNMVSEGQKLFNNKDNQKTILKLGILPHRLHLLVLLTNIEPSNYFTNLEIQKKYRHVIDIINSIVPGEFQIAQNGMFYVEEKFALDVQNLATGSKLFFMIKLLLANGSLKENTILVLDEPESHLHPEWINKFAEILVMLIREIKISVLVTTHSPNFLLALDLYSKKLGLKEQSHFYLSQPIAGSCAVSLACIDDNINEAYAHLSIPLLEMTVEQQEYQDKEEE